MNDENGFLEGHDMTDEFLEGLEKAFVKAWRIDRGEYCDPEYHPAYFREFCEDKMTRLLLMMRTD